MEELDARLRDILLTRLRERLDYHGGRRGEAVLYRTRDGRVSMTVTDEEAKNFEGRAIGRNSVDPVLFIENVNKGGDVSSEDALSWPADNFGEGKAARPSPPRGQPAARRDWAR